MIHQQSESKVKEERQRCKADKYDWKVREPYASLLSKTSVCVA